MSSKWTLFALLFSVAVNIAVVGTLVYFWQQNSSEEVEINVLKHSPDEPGLVWFHSSNIEPETAQELDSLRMLYQQELQSKRGKISQNRDKLFSLLMRDRVDRDSLDEIIKTISDYQIKTEQLTVDHLLTLKPLLPEQEWKMMIRDLGRERKIHTKIIKIDKDSNHIILNREDNEDIHFFNNVE